MTMSLAMRVTITLKSMSHKRQKLTMRLLLKFLNKMLLDAINIGASDLHFEPYEKFYRVRYRVDGILREITQPPLAITQSQVLQSVVKLFSETKKQIVNMPPLQREQLPVLLDYKLLVIANQVTCPAVAPYIAIRGVPACIHLALDALKPV